MSGGVGSSRRSSLRVRMGLKVTMARLILNCEGVGLVMRELGRDIVMIGRAPSNQIVIDHPTVSAQHAVLLRTGDSYSLKDLNSASGTQVNGDFVTDAELKDGDTIRFGSVIAVFAGAYRKPSSSHGDQKVLDEYFRQRRTADCIRDGVSVLEFGLTRNGDSKKSLVGEVPFGYALR